MSRLILTMNGGGNWIPANVEASHKAAAARWGADYCQICDVPHNEHFRLKHYKCESVTGAYDRAMWVDGDVIIREDCPNPFELVPAGRFAGVLNAQVDPENQDPLQEFYWRLLAGEFKHERVTVPTPIKTLKYGTQPYINGGVYLWSPRKHHAIFSTVCHWLEGWALVEAMVEQTVFNMAIAHTEEDVFLLDPLFNRMGPDVWKEGRCEGYMTHFAAYGEATRAMDRRSVMESAEWREVVIA